MHEQTVAGLKSALGSKLVSLIKHDHGYLMVLDEVSTDALRRVAQSLGKQRPDLVFFTPSELADSQDVFPLELLEAQSSYELLHGEDVLAQLNIPQDALRLQIEEDLKTKRTWLRQRYLDICHDSKKAARLPLGAFETLPPILRAMLRYKERRVPSTVTGQLEAAAEAFALEKDFLDSLQRGQAPDRGVERYMTLLNALIAAIENG